MARIRMMRAAHAVTIEDAVLHEISQITLPKVKGAPNGKSKTYTTGPTNASVNFAVTQTGFSGRWKAS